MATTNTQAEQDVRMCGACGQPVPRLDAVPRHGDELCEPCADGVPPVVGPHGYVLSDAECRQAAAAAVKAFLVLDVCETNDERSLFDAHAWAYSALDDGLPYAFWHEDAHGNPCSAIARKQAHYEKAKQISFHGRAESLLDAARQATDKDSPAPIEGRMAWLRSVVRDIDAHRKPLAEKQAEQNLGVK